MRKIVTICLALRMSLKIKSSAFDDRGGSISALSKELFDFSMPPDSFLYKLVDDFVVA